MSMFYKTVEDLKDYYIGGTRFADPKDKDAYYEIDTEWMSEKGIHSDGGRNYVDANGNQYTWYDLRLAHFIKDDYGNYNRDNYGTNNKKYKNNNYASTNLIASVEQVTAKPILFWPSRNTNVNDDPTYIDLPETAGIGKYSKKAIRQKALNMPCVKRAVSYGKCVRCIYDYSVAGRLIVKTEIWIRGIIPDSVIIFFKGKFNRDGTPVKGSSVVMIPSCLYPTNENFHDAINAAFNSTETEANTGERQTGLSSSAANNSPGTDVENSGDSSVSSDNNAKDDVNIAIDRTSNNELGNKAQQGEFAGTTEEGNSSFNHITDTAPIIDTSEIFGFYRHTTYPINKNRYIVEPEPDLQTTGHDSEDGEGKEVKEVYDLFVVNENVTDKTQIADLKRIIEKIAKAQDGSVLALIRDQILDLKPTRPIKLSVEFDIIENGVKAGAETRAGWLTGLEPNQEIVFDTKVLKESHPDLGSAVYTQLQRQNAYIEASETAIIIHELGHIWSNLKFRPKLEVDQFNQLIKTTSSLKAGEIDAQRWEAYYYRKKYNLYYELLERKYKHINIKKGEKIDDFLKYFYSVSR